MSGMDFIRQDGTPLDAFLQADVGQDPGGNTVSVLPALARRLPDPWDEAPGLSDLPRENALTMTATDAIMALPYPAGIVQGDDTWTHPPHRHTPLA